MRRQLALALALVAAAMLLSAPAAQAIYDPIGSGATKLRLDPSFRALLKSHGVKLEASAPASLEGGLVSFPASGGKFDPTSEEGSVEHEGALVFRAGTRSIPLKALQLKTTQRHAPFSAKLGGSQLKIATSKPPRVARAGFAETVAVNDLRLSAKVAGRLAKKLHLPGVFVAGQSLGSTKTTAVPATVALQQAGKVSFAPDPGILAKLGALFVALNPIAPAELAPGPLFTLPIFSGEIALDGTSGSLQTLGSLEALQLGGGQIFWAEPLLDLGARSLSGEAEVQPAPPYPGKLGSIQLAGLDLAAATVSADPRARTIAVAGARLALSAQSAAAFNEAFAAGRALFGAGEPLGAISFTARGQ